uniref:U-box domain-containing protein n=2 Tax=Auxenochlorella protothecoides TaxID=3075 RepID=A0A1D2A535_AUXPR
MPQGAQELYQELLRTANGDHALARAWMLQMGYPPLPPASVEQSLPSTAPAKIDMRAKVEASAPQHFFCPIAMHIMRDPVVLSTGQTYDHPSIERWLSEGHTKCPITGVELPTPVSMAPNLVLRQSIEEWAARRAPWLLDESGGLKPATVDRTDDFMEMAASTPPGTDLREEALRRQREEQERHMVAASTAAAAVSAAAAAAAEGTDREAEAERASADAAQSALDEQDAIYRAMMAAAGESLQPGMGAPGGERRALGTLRRKAQAAFVEEEEEAAPKRKLIPITYTEEELEAMRRAAEAAAQEEQAASGAPEQASKPEAAATLPSPAPAAAAPQPADPEQLKRQVMARVPKGQDAVFAWQVRWELLDAAPADVKQRIQAWVGKRIQMLMGEEEESFASFVMQQVARHQPALKVLEALQDVLDEDAPEFVTKLYQVIIYESLKLEHSL